MPMPSAQVTSADLTCPAWATKCAAFIGCQGACSFTRMHVWIHCTCCRGALSTCCRPSGMPKLTDPEQGQRFAFAGRTGLPCFKGLGGYLNHMTFVPKRPQSAKISGGALWCTHSQGTQRPSPPSFCGSVSSCACCSGSSCASRQSRVCSRVWVVGIKGVSHACILPLNGSARHLPLAGRIAPPARAAASAGLAAMPRNGYVRRFCHLPAHAGQGAPCLLPNTSLLLGSCMSEGLSCVSLLLNLPL